MNVKRQDKYTVSLLKLIGKGGKARYYSLIHKEPISDALKEKLNHMPGNYAYMTEKQARDRFRKLVATPIKIEDKEKPKSLREIINESIP